MQIGEMAEALGWKLLTENTDTTREVKGCYCGDLLSWVMGKCPADAAWMPAPAHLRDCAHTAVPRDSLRLPVRRSLGVHAESSAGRPNSRELTAACSGDCPTHKKLSGNITSATANTEAIA